MKTAYLVTKPWLGTVDAADLTFGQAMLAKFLGQLAAADPASTTVCFYTEGVKAALGGTPFEATLASIERAGVPLLLCGTCVDHYGIADRITVGRIADMPTIAAALGGADKVITI